MPEQERSAADGAAGGRDPGLVSRSIEEFVSQLRAFSDRARALAAGAVPSLPSLPSPPGAMSAAQLKAIADAVTAQRASLQAMTAQFQAFDEQLAVFERILEPLVEWSATWARLEEGISSLVRRDPGTDRRSSGEA
jgi:hypothetical protein